jgi:hypothetical protein
MHCVVLDVVGPQPEALNIMVRLVQFVCVVDPVTRGSSRNVE